MLDVCRMEKTIETISDHKGYHTMLEYLMTVPASDIVDDVCKAYGIEEWEYGDMVWESVARVGRLAKIRCVGGVTL